MKTMILNQTSQEVKELKLGQITQDVVESLGKATTDEDIANSSFIRDGQTIYTNFECCGKLCNYKGYENFYERLWVWACIGLEEEVNIIAALDLGNGCCSVKYYDVYIQEIIDNYNEIEKIRIKALNLEGTYSEEPLGAMSNL